MKLTCLKYLFSFLEAVYNRLCRQDCLAPRCNVIENESPCEKGKPLYKKVMESKIPRKKYFSAIIYRSTHM